MNRFERCNQRADENKRTHYERRERLARAHYERHPERGAGVDVEARCGRDWWKDAGLWPDDQETEEVIYLRQGEDWYMTADGYWVYGHHVGYAPVYQELVKRPVERDCVGRMRRECQRADLLGGVEDEPVYYATLWTELLAEIRMEDVLGVAA